jgi:hypothetical protein
VRRAGLAHEKPVRRHRVVPIVVEIRENAVTVPLERGDDGQRVLAGRRPVMEELEVLRLLQLRSVSGEDDLAVEHVGDFHEAKRCANGVVLLRHQGAALDGGRGRRLGRGSRRRAGSR